MGKHNIEKFSLGYEALKFVGRAYHNALYSEVYTFNRPAKLTGPHIFVCNHQNALMDAMAVLFAANRPIVFLARSDIFQNPRVASLLYFLKILPVYRMRDGFDSLKNNDEVFLHTLRVLKSCRSVGIYPEGSHAGLRRLRPLQKGVGRIAFQTLEEQGTDKSLMIIPTGIDYEHFQKFGTRLVVKFGQPFDVAPYFPLYKQDPAKALNALKERISEVISKQMVDITSERWYDTIDNLRDWIWEYGRFKGLKPLQTYQLTVDLSHKLSVEAEQSEVMFKLEETCGKLSSTLKKYNLKPRELDHKKAIFKNLFATTFAGLFTLIGIPVFLLFGWFHFLVKRIVNKHIKDPQFRTSVRFGVTVIGYILFAFMFNAWIFFFFTWYWYMFAVIITGVSGIVGLRMFSKARLFFNRLRSSVFHSLGNKEISRALELRNSLFVQIEFLIQ